jgi:hypothetical protein
LWDLNALGRLDLESLDSSDLIELACARAGRDFTQEEQRYFSVEPLRCP